MLKKRFESALMFDMRIYSYIFHIRVILKKKKKNHCTVEIDVFGKVILLKGRHQYGKPALYGENSKHGGSQISITIQEIQKVP